MCTLPPPPTHTPQASLRALLASRERALRNKEAELEALRATLGIKDRLIAELQEDVGRLSREGAELTEQLRELEKEKNSLEVCGIYMAIQCLKVHFE